MSTRAFLRLQEIYFFCAAMVGEDVVAVGGDIFHFPVFDDLAGGRDEDGIALGEFVLTASGYGNAVGVDDLVVRIGEELEGE